jgi:hypothetical protein
MFPHSTIFEPDTRFQILFNTAFMEMAILVSYAILPVIIENM